MKRKLYNKIAPTNIPAHWKKLENEFYLRKDVVKIAKELLGKLLVTNFDGTVTAGRITETEAYNGVVDKASHAYAGRRTKRTEIMFANGGYAYVYLCYGIHHLFNIVTNITGVPHAILIRSIEPVAGIDTMLFRKKKKQLNKSFGKGPGNVSKALGIFTDHSGLSLLSNEIFIADDGFRLNKKKIISTPRIGVDYAAEDALLLYRFLLVD